MTSKTYTSLIFLTVLLGLSLINGCNQGANVKVPTFSDYPQQQKHPLAIALRFDEDYSGYAFIEKYAIGTSQLPLGDALMKNSVFVAEQAFDKVYVAEGSKAEIPKDARAVLTPKVISASMSKFISVFDKVDFVIDVEWLMQDRRGNTVWLKTIRGKARNSCGNAFTIISQRDKRIRLAMKDLFNNTYQAFLTSPLIRTFEQDQ